MQQTKTRIQIIIKMVNELKLSVVHFARPNLMQIYALRVDLPLEKWKIRTGPPCLRAAGHGPLRLRAAGPPACF